jgi:hypothetical protein
MKRAILVLALVLAVFSLSAAAGNIEGVYNCKGVNPGTGTTYQGSVTITRNSAVYAVVWTVGSQVYMGVGLLQGDQFSVGYTDAAKTMVGIVIYKVNGATLNGVWAVQGGSQTGTEVLTKKH